MICGRESLVCVASGQCRQSKLDFRIDFLELINQVARVKTTELHLWRLTFMEEANRSLVRLIGLGFSRYLNTFGGCQIIASANLWCDSSPTHDG